MCNATRKETDTMKQSSRTLIYRDYWNAERDHRPYTDMIHTTHDKPLDQWSDAPFPAMFATCGIEDGDENTARRTFLLL